MAPPDRLYGLPEGLPVPVDDGAASHLPGSVVPSVPLPSTGGGAVRLDRVVEEMGAARSIVFCYPRAGGPGEQLPPGWDDIPGARGCTPESCGFRDRHADLVDRGCVVFGLSTQTTAEQRDHVARNGLPYDILSDEEREFADELGLPTFDAAGMTLLRRLTLVIQAGVVRHVFYPVFPPDRHAEEVLGWLRDAV